MAVTSFAFSTGMKEWSRRGNPRPSMITSEQAASRRRLRIGPPNVIRARRLPMFGAIKERRTLDPDNGAVAVRPDLDNLSEVRVMAGASGLRGRAPWRIEVSAGWARCPAPFGSRASELLSRGTRAYPPRGGTPTYAWEGL